MGRQAPQDLGQGSGAQAVVGQGQCLQALGVYMEARTSIRFLPAPRPGPSSRDPRRLSLSRGSVRWEMGSPARGLRGGGAAQAHELGLLPPLWGPGLSLLVTVWPEDWDTQHGRAGVGGGTPPTSQVPAPPPLCCAPSPEPHFLAQASVENPLEDAQFPVSQC